jgi:hypothetical protein
MHYIKEHFSNKYESTIEFSDIVDKNIIMALYDETAIYWVHNLASDKKLACVTDDWVVFYCEKFDVYFFYYLKFDGFSNKKCMDSLKEVVDKNKYTHLILSYDSGRMVDDFESNSSIEKFDYSLLNFNSEILYENNIKNIWDCKKVKYFFSCSNMIRRDTNGKEYSSIWQDENTNKFILDYKYAFTCFYIKLGFSYFQKGEQGFEVSNRQNKVFLYSKSPNKNSNHPRYNAIIKALETNKILNKSYTDEDWFWYYANYNYYHTPFINDYNLCKFNLIMETQSINSFDSYHHIKSKNQFFSEKTLKGLLVSTPAYILLQYPVYEELKRYGFYFLNEEFGEYTYSNYERFCEWLKNCSDIEFDEMFNKAFEKSRKNKELVETYIYSDKEREINLLINS